MTNGNRIASPNEECLPFVLLDDARVAGAAPARLFQNPVEVIAAQSETEIPELLDRLEAARARGLHAAGYLSYEAGKGFGPARRRDPESEGRAEMPLG